MGKSSWMSNEDHKACTKRATEPLQAFYDVFNSKTARTHKLGRKTSEQRHLLIVKHCC